MWQMITNAKFIDMDDPFEVTCYNSKLISYPNRDLKIIGNPKHAAMALLKYMLSQMVWWEASKSTGIYMGGYHINGLHLGWEFDLFIDYEPLLGQTTSVSFNILKEEFDKLKKYVGVFIMSNILGQTEKHGDFVYNGLDRIDRLSRIIKIMLYHVAKNVIL